MTESLEYVSSYRAMICATWVKDVRSCEFNAEKYPCMEINERFYLVKINEYLFLGIHRYGTDYQHEVKDVCNDKENGYLTITLVSGIRIQIPHEERVIQ